MTAVSAATSHKPSLEVRVDSIWLWPVALVAFLLSWPALRAIAVRVLGGKLRAQAMAEQPDRIYLVHVLHPKWRDERSRESAERQLSASGFAPAGVFMVREMPELTLALHANAAESAYAMLYDHPRSGFWAEFVTRYEDGSLADYTTLEPMEVELPAGSVHVAAPGLSLTELWKKMLAERPRKNMVACNSARAAQDFERGYAESVAYHKKHAPAVVQAQGDSAEDMKHAA